MTQPVPDYAAKAKRPAGNDALGAGLMLAGAIVGALLGYFAFFWIAKQGYYALVLPGGLCALGATCGRTRWLFVPPIVGIMALFVGLFTEWRFRPFIADPSFTYFLTQIPKLYPITLLMIGLGTILGFVLPFTRR